MFCINDKERKAPHKFLNLSPQLPCYATGCVYVCFHVCMHCVYVSVFTKMYVRMYVCMNICVTLPESAVDCPVGPTIKQAGEPRVRMLKTLY